VNADEAAISKSGTVEACGGLAPGVTDLPMQRIEQSIHPTGSQVAGLEHLKAASSQANDILKASCPSQIPLTPLGRLDAVQKRLVAMIQAVQVVRGPLYEFYNSLTDEQRRNFDAMETAKLQSGAKAPASAPAATGLPALCDERAASFSQLPVERIEQTIRLTQQQRGAFDTLKSASSKAASEVRTSCPSQMPQTIVDRLGAVDTRLIAMLQAVKTLHPALDDFYASLDDEQKRISIPWDNPGADPRAADRIFASASCGPCARFASTFPATTSALERVGAARAISISKRGFLASTAAVSLFWPSLARAQEAIPIRTCGSSWPSGRGPTTLSRASWARGLPRSGARASSSKIAAAPAQHRRREVAKAEPNGYTVLVTTSAYAVNPSLTANAGYVPETDFKTAVVAVTTPNIIVAAAGLKASNLKELLEAAKSEKFTYGMPGPGTTPHLSAEKIFKVLSKVDIPPVPFTGARRSSTRCSAGT
jgi:hypothetical protein